MAQGREATTGTRRRFWRSIDAGLPVAAASASVSMSRRWGYQQIEKGRPDMAAPGALIPARLRDLHEQLGRIVTMLRDGKLPEPESDSVRSLRLDTRRKDALRACGRAALEIESLASEVRSDL